jgi:predicted nucleic acid-binding protein
MIVVADASPLNYLLLIDAIGLLPDLFDRVLIPKAVFQELQHPRTPPQMRQWATHLPEWVEVRTVASVAPAALMRLDIGEREAILLALEVGAGVVLIDEADGRLEAQRFLLEVRGTLGILERGARLGKVDFRRALSRLDQTSFRLSPTVREAFLRRNP